MSGFVGCEKEENESISVYLNIQRNGYEPFILGAISTFNDNDSDIKGVIKKGDYLLYLHQKYIDVDDGNLTISGFDSNGVFINVSKYLDNEEVNITNKDGNSLATFDSKTNTINYADGSSETLY